ncbi:MAG TPA: DEAD/DEAH box helicase, partial [Bacillota bacterium]|nr:DEAD/DEAH box helicase [Bacillota bacterium]
MPGLILAVVQAVAGQSISPDLAAPVTILDGVGPERAAHLARLKVNTVGELLLHRPRRYEDRRAAKPIAALRLGEAVTVRGKVVALGVKYWRQRTRSVFELVLDDGTGRLHCRWWQQPYLEKNFKVGEELCVFGKTKDLKPRAMEHPEVEIIEAGEEASIHLHRIVPVYPLVEGLTQRWLRALIWRTLGNYEPQLAEPWPGLKLNDFPSFREAVRQLHFPDEAAGAERARQRLALDELLQLQTSLQRRRRTLYTKATAWPCGGDNRLIRPLLKSLGFQLTGAQTRVLREVRADLSGAHPMRRLLQGDVGSGKTVVAACSALMALESGFNVALMAPTEILAEQHFHTFRRWFEPLGVTVHLRTGSRATSTAAGSNDSPKGAEGSFFVGTHALIQDAFAPERLGLV